VSKVQFICAASAGVMMLARMMPLGAVLFVWCLGAGQCFWGWGNVSGGGLSHCGGKSLLCVGVQLAGR